MKLSTHHFSAKVTSLLVVLSVLACFSANAQLYTPNGNVQSSSNSNIGVNTSSPDETVEIGGTNATLQIQGTGYYPTSVLQVSDFEIRKSVYPSCGSGATEFTGNNASMTFYNGRVSINGPGTSCYSPAPYGDVVMDKVGVSHLLVRGSNGGLDLDSGYKLGVNGNGYVEGDFEVEKDLIVNNGKVGIGVDSSTIYDGTGNFNLYVTEGIRTERVKVDDVSKWADYVFNEDYDLKSLKEVENYIEEESHLPGIPTKEEVSANGIDVAEMDARLLKKVEELTLYTIEQQKKIEQLKKENKELKELKEEVEALKAKMNE